MENFTNRWKWSISIVAIGLLSLYSCSDAILSEDLKDSQELARKSSSVNFSGSVIDPLTCNPVAGAVVSSGETTVITDSDGNFNLEVERGLLSNTVTVEKEGHVPYAFAACFDDQFIGDIRIDLPTRQVCVWIGPNEGAWYKVVTNDQCITYRIDILRGAIDRWTEICIGPGGNAYGAGIDDFFAIPSINIDAPLVENLEIFKKIDVRFKVTDLINVAQKSSCFSASSSASTAGIEDLSDFDDILSVLYGPDHLARLLNGEVIVFSPITGTVVPGLGIIGTDSETGNPAVYPFLDDGCSIGDGLSFEKDGGVILLPGTPADGPGIPDPGNPDVPHQSTPDGGG